jgi:hypothetical protein
MSDVLAETVFGVPWIVIAAAAFAVAIVYAVIDMSAGTTGPRQFVLRWFHSLCWVLLCLAALARTKLTPLPEDWALSLGALGGIAYLAFVGSWLTRPRTPGD